MHGASASVPPADLSQMPLTCLPHNHTGDRPFLISGADDRVAKVWDYQTKACVQTLEGHAHNVSAVMFHPELPVGFIGALQCHACEQMIAMLS
jgi:WD40 repeat protein